MGARNGHAGLLRKWPSNHPADVLKSSLFIDIDGPNGAMRTASEVTVSLERERCGVKRLRRFVRFRRQREPTEA